MTPKQLLIVAHAPSPNTRKLAEAALRGARHPDIEQV
ncbi:MAG TPA: flavodoxin, partial [Pseudomonas sp.]|nr:flavodoxin [Pseudomonas sp.]